MDLVFLYFLFLFYFLLIYFSSFYFQNSGFRVRVISHTVTSVTSDGGVTTLITELKKRKQKILEQSNVIQHKYHMLTPCFTHGHQDRMHSSQHGLFVKVYKIDYFVKSSLSSSLVLPNIRLPHNPTLRVLSYNIQSNQKVTAYSGHYFTAQYYKQCFHFLIERIAQLIHRLD